jgi:Leucine-rich repeat (LRR) protein
MTLKTKFSGRSILFVFLLIPLFFENRTMAADLKESFVAWCSANLQKPAKDPFFATFKIENSSGCAAAFTVIKSKDVLDLSFQNVQDLSFLEFFPHLKELHLSGTRTKSLSPLKHLTNLKILILNSRSVSNIEVLSRLSSLEELTLDSTFVTSLNPIAKLANLKKLIFREGPKLKDISALNHLENLEVLYLQSDLVTDFSLVSNLKKLEDLQIQSVHLKDLTFLSQLKDLRSLLLHSKKNVFDLKPLAQLNQLDQLHIEYNGLTDISPVANMKALRHLYIGYNKITDLGPLSQLTNLATLRLTENPVRSLAPIASLPLTHLEVMTGTVQKTEAACSTGDEINALVSKFCKRFRKI